MAKTQKKPGFEEQLEQLEAVIAALEQGDMPLDKSIEEYRRGVELTRAHKAQLEGARRQLALLDADEGEDGENGEAK